ncbi:hypothetical protein TWF173_004597 [Orbilia oligospora]|nr:hypothetical protein TWF173_004597 [Orbilia oligospora]
MRAVDFWKANGRFDTAALETAIMNAIRKRSDSPENEMLIDEDSSGCKVAGQKPDESVTGNIKEIAARLAQLVTDTEKADRELQASHGAMIDAGLFYRFNVGGLARFGLEEYEQFSTILAATTTYLEKPGNNREMLRLLVKAQGTFEGV